MLRELHEDKKPSFENVPLLFWMKLLSKDRSSFEMTDVYYMEEIKLHQTTCMNIILYVFIVNK